MQTVYSTYTPRKMYFCFVKLFNVYMLYDIYTNGYQLILLQFISLLSIICGISVIIAKNPIVSVLYLIGLFFSIASYLMELGLNFIGLSYLLVYVGAVSILFLFILMLINVRISELVTDNNNSVVLGLLLSLLILTPTFARGNHFHIESDLYQLSNYSNSQYPLPSNEPWLILSDLIKSIRSIVQRNTEDIYFVTSKLWDGALGEMSHITSIGNVIYTNYPLWLVLTSIILLLAMVGAIVITIKQ